MDLLRSLQTISIVKSSIIAPSADRPHDRDFLSRIFQNRFGATPRLRNARRRNLEVRSHSINISHLLLRYSKCCHFTKRRKSGTRENLTEPVPTEMRQDFERFGGPTGRLFPALLSSPERYRNAPRVGSGVLINEELDGNSMGMFSAKLIPPATYRRLHPPHTPPYPLSLPCTSRNTVPRRPESPCRGSRGASGAAGLRP